MFGLRKDVGTEGAWRAVRHIRFAWGRFSIAVHVICRRITRKLIRAGMRCPECRGKGFVVNCELVEFIEEVGLPTYYAAEMLAHQEERLGTRLPASAWAEIGIPEHTAEFFVKDMRNAWPVWECSLCSSSSHADITERAFENAQRAASRVLPDQPSP